MVCLPRLGCFYLLYHCVLHDCVVVCFVIVCALCDCVLWLIFYKWVLLLPVCETEGWAAWGVWSNTA